MEEKGPKRKTWSLVIHSLRLEYGLDLLLEIKGMALSLRFITTLNDLAIPQNIKRKRNV